MIDEQRIEHLARELGAEAARRVDAAATAHAVLARLRAEPPVRHGGLWREWRPVRVLQAAAAIVVLLASALVVREAIRPPARAVVAAPVELEELAASELAEVLDSLAYEAPVSELVPLGLEQLDESELRELLAEMEG